MKNKSYKPASLNKCMDNSEQNNTCLSHWEIRKSRSASNDTCLSLYLHAYKKTEKNQTRVEFVHVLSFFVMFFIIQFMYENTIYSAKNKKKFESDKVAAGEKFRATCKPIRR